ncbi:MAG: helix-turn-helix domain-containing protein [Thiohalocapsa sp.]|nr:helix-turn-helix domain-containing protein [Thiohalocapsa sp.]MCF7991582.1 helix-turn-helix domain-containing protein [Thiohalocapsa sp.]
MKHTRHIEPVGLSIPDVVQATGLGRSTVYQEIAAGRLKTFKVGRRRLVAPAALTEWAKARESEAAA